MTLELWKTKHRKGRSYAHFDSRVSLDRVWGYISNPQRIASHSFYPFIHFQKKADKYSKHIDGVGGIIEKPRELYYSAHLDRYIYQYYGFLLNQKYNSRISEDGFEHSIIAYRDNLNGECNIDFAKRAIDFIRNLGNCYIIIGDFTKFFDSLDHGHLKRMLCNLLEVDSLPKDYYAVYKNITRFSVWELEHLLTFHGLDNNFSGYQELNRQQHVLSPEAFRANRKAQIRQPTKTQGFGIPQGSAISAIFSNVYMLDADKGIYDFIKRNNGLYMRYSDDFIVVLPRTTESDFRGQLDILLSYIRSTPRLELQPEKTKIYQYVDGVLASRNSTFFPFVPDTPNILNYLGFSFDGKIVTIRDKTITKYYYRMYRKVKAIVTSGGITKKGTRISGKNLYAKYSIKGAYPQKGDKGISLSKKHKGNFLTYVGRAKRIFGSDEAIDRSTKHHMDKIRKQLKKINNPLP